MLREKKNREFLKKEPVLQSFTKLAGIRYKGESLKKRGGMELTLQLKKS